LPEETVLPKKITVAVEGSQPSLRAAEYALRLASSTGSKVTALYVILVPQYIDDITKTRLRHVLTARGDKVLAKIRKMARESKVSVATKILETDTSIVSTICAFSEQERVDLIVLGVRTDTSPVARLMLGSVATGVANNALCPVLVVR
jgi:nucleotide-binding universal stress UspA family protein